MPDVSTSPRHPQIVEAAVWAEEHGELIGVVYDFFRQSAKWPNVEALQRSFERRDVDIDVSKLGWSMPSPLGFLEQEHLVLLVRGLYYVPGARGLLDDWRNTLALCYQRYREADEPKLRYADLVGELGMDERRADEVSVLFQRETWPFGSGGGPMDDWWREIRSGIRAVRNAETVEDVLAAREALEYPPPVDEPPQLEEVGYLHIRIELLGRKTWGDDLLVFDVSEDWVRERILDPRAQGSPITVKGRTVRWEEIGAVKIARTTDPAETVAAGIREADVEKARHSRVLNLGRSSPRWRVVDVGDDLTDELISQPPGADVAALSEGSRNSSEPHRDVFVSHASEDKDAIARPLAEELSRRGRKVWFDEYELMLGDSLRERIEEGLAHSTVGVVILSHAFFSKRWPQEELNGLYARLLSGERNVIVPVWHGLDREDVIKYAPTLANLFAGDSAHGAGKLADEIERLLDRLAINDFKGRTVE
jgi:hypothetical protein